MLHKALTNTHANAPVCVNRTRSGLFNCLRKLRQNAKQVGFVLSCIGITEKHRKANKTEQDQNFLEFPSGFDINNYLLRMQDCRTE